MTDTVNHPKHYASSSVEVIEGIEAWELGFHLGNVVKYCARAGKKDPTKVIEDLKKAQWYLARKIHLLESEVEGSKSLRPNEMNP
jgi:hypothetical protein